MNKFPSTTFNVVDESTTTGNAPIGAVAMLGITERGEVRTPRIIRSIAEYNRYYGGLVSYSDFPLYCYRALQAGTTIIVSRILHYTDITDATTGEGTKATIAITESTNSLVATASSVGSWGNGLTVTVSSPVNVALGGVDIKVTLSGYPDLEKTAFNVPTAPTAAQLAELNASFELVDFTVTNSIPTGTATLATGADDYSSLAASDYVGNQAAGTGLYAFDGESSPVRVCAPEMSDNAFEIAVTAYAAMRQDMRAILIVPTGLTGLECVDFMNKTGAYSGTVIDSFYASYVFGDIEVFDELLGTYRYISAVGDVLGVEGKKDQTGLYWLSSAGINRGQITSVQKLRYNLFPPSRKDEANSFNANRGNSVIKHSNGNYYFWGNNTTQRKETLLKFWNVASLLVYLKRELSAIAQTKLFEPNSPTTWQEMFLDVSALMDNVQALEGVFAYRYEGDQNVTEIADVQVNTVEGINNGVYKYRLHIQPTPAIQEIVINAIVTDAGVELEVN